MTYVQCIYTMYNKIADVVRMLLNKFIFCLLGKCMLRHLILRCSPKLSAFPHV